MCRYRAPVEVTQIVPPAKTEASTKQRRRVLPTNDIRYRSQPIRRRNTLI